MTLAETSAATGRIAVITGAASGIGAATAARFAAEGWGVLLADISAKVHDVAGGLVGRAESVRADVATEEGWQEIAAAGRALGPVRVLVSNAVRQIVAPLTELPPAGWDEQLAVNLRGAYLGLRELLPDLAEGPGAVVLVSSVHAQVGLPGHPAYAASKAGLAALARQVAVDYAPVRVNCVVPGPILTPAWDRITPDARERSVAQTALKRFGSPAEVAGVVHFLCSADAGFVTGTSIVVDGGWSVVKDSA